MSTRDGALYPDQPLNLPENTPVLVRVLTATDRDLTPEEILALRPKAPRLTVEQFEEIMRKNTLVPHQNLWVSKRSQLGLDKTTKGVPPLPSSPPHRPSAG